MLASLRHRPISGRNHKDGTVHLGSTGDHVFNIVRMTRAVDVSVVTVRRFVLHMTRRNRDGLRGVTHGATLCNIRIGLNSRQAFCSLNSQNSGRCGCLAMVDVTDSAHVDVRLRSLKGTLCHYPNSRSICARTLHAARQIHVKSRTRHPHARHPHINNKPNTRAE